MVRFPIVAIAISLSACAPIAATPVATIPPEPARSLTATEQLADDLAAADQAFERRDRAALAPLVERIVRQGARSSQSSGKFAAWSALAPTQNIPMRGRALGPAWSRGVVRGGAAFATEQVFLGGESTVLTVGSRPRDAVRITVTSADDRTVCSLAPAHARDCKIMPLYTQRYRIELQNAGAGDARYYLVVD